MDTLKIKCKICNQLVEAKEMGKVDLGNNTYEIYCPKCNNSYITNEEEESYLEVSDITEVGERGYYFCDQCKNRINIIDIREYEGNKVKCPICGKEETLNLGDTKINKVSLEKEESREYRVKLEKEEQKGTIVSLEKEEIESLGVNAPLNLGNDKSVSLEVKEISKDSNVNVENRVLGTYESSNIPSGLANPDVFWLDDMKEPDAGFDFNTFIDNQRCLKCGKLFCICDMICKECGKTFCNCNKGRKAINSLIGKLREEN